MKTSLILPCYFLNNDYVQMTVRCLASLKDRPDEIIIINDGSPYTPASSTVFPLYSEFVDKYVTLPKNSGYSKAANTGLEVATGDILIVGNNDLIFPDKWIEQLVTPIEEGYDIATCWTSDQTDVKRKDEIENDAKFGSLFAMKRTVYEQLGGFDEQFRGYFSDLDYRHRALDEGLKIGKNLSLVVEHEAKATYKETDPDDSEFQKAKILYEIKWGYNED